MNITLSDLTVMLIAGIIVVVIIYAILFSMKRKEDAYNDTCPLRKESATVVEKYPAGGAAAGISEMPVLFELGDGSRIKLVCRNGGEMLVGDKGYLEWQGNRYIDFRRNNY